MYMYDYKISILEFRSINVPMAMSKHVFCVINVYVHAINNYCSCDLGKSKVTFVTEAVSLRIQTTQY